MRSLRKSSAFFLVISVLASLLCLAFFHAANRREAATPGFAVKRDLVKSLGLADLCLFTEARYTRHPALADLHAPFQDGPLSFEHFPSGSLVPPVRIIRDRQAAHD